MGTLAFEDTVQCGFHVLDQHGQLKFGAVMQIVMDRYGRAVESWSKTSRGAYTARTGLAPISTFIAVARSPHQLHIDDEVELRIAGDYGFVPGSGDTPARYGGQDRIELTAAGTTVASWTQHWLWHHVRSGDLLHEPAPEIGTSQDQEIAKPPPRPRPHAPSIEERFRWTPRETDLNQHINVLGYLERAENVLANADDLGTEDAASVQLWFRRPAFLGDLMTARAEREGEGEAMIVELQQESTGNLCATLAFAP